MSKKGGDIIEIFSVDGLHCCPVKAMTVLKNIATVNCMNFSPFTFDDGKNLTQNEFTLALKKWASPYKTREFIGKLSGHCCRNVIPNLLATRPDLTNVEDIMVWGRWSSDAYKVYAKKSRMTRKIIFDKISHAVRNISVRNARDHRR